MSPGGLRYQAVACACPLGIAAFLGSICARWTVARAWSFRLSELLAVGALTTGIAGAFHHGVAAQFWLSLLMLSAAAMIFATRRFFDIVVLSVVCLGLNIVIVVHLVTMMAPKIDRISSLLFLAAAALLGGTVARILAVMRAASAAGDKP